MAEPVKYRSPLRRARALETRALIREAARAAFVDRGFGGTTIADIASQAGVAEQTVYAVYGTKRAILEELVRLGVRGENGDVELARTARWQAVLEPSDPAEVVARFAAICGEIYGRISDMLEVVRGARGADAELAAILEGHERARRRDLALVVARLDELGALAPGASTRTAGDALWAVASPDVYRMLVRERGWSRRRYVDWLAVTLRGALLRG